MKMRLAVVSDLHCHPQRPTENSSHLLSNGPRVPAHNHPVEALVDLIQLKSLRADYLVAPGDFTDKADIHGYVVGVQVAREIAQLLGSRRVVGTVGNHDIDSRGLNGDDPFYLGTHVFRDFPIADIAQRSRFFDPRFGYALFDEGDIRFLIINSVVSHRTKEEAKRGSFTPTQLENLVRDTQSLHRLPIQVCVFHHHPIPHEDMDLGPEDLMVGGEQLLGYLEASGYLLAIHGHKHHPRFRYAASGGSNGIPVFSAGSFAALITGKLVRSLRNTFHLLEIEVAADPKSYPRGKIWSWELSTAGGWIETSVKQSGFPHVTGFGCRSDPRHLAAMIQATLQSERYVSWEDLEHLSVDFAYLSPADRRRVAEIVVTSGVVCDDVQDPMYFSRPKQK